MDGVLPFHDSGSWNLDRLLEEGEEPAAENDGSFHVEDVVRLESPTGNVPGTLQRVAGVVLFRPNAALPSGNYRAYFRDHPGAPTEASRPLAVSDLGDGPLPSFEAKVTHATIPGNVVMCEAQYDGGSCFVRDTIALSDVHAARYSVVQTFAPGSSLRSQLLTKVTVDKESQNCVGCAELEAFVSRQARAVTMEVEVLDLRRGVVAKKEKLSESYEGPLNEQPRTLTDEDYLANDCVAPPEGLEREWCAALRSSCEEDPTRARCDALAGHCKDVPLPSPDDDHTDDEGDDAQNLESNAKTAPNCSAGRGIPSDGSGTLWPGFLAFGLLAVWRQLT